MTETKAQAKPIDFIRTLPPFDRLDTGELDEVAQSVETAEFPVGAHILIQDGSPSQYLYIIRRGAVRLVREGQVVDVLEGKEYFGYPSLLNQNASAYDVVAEENALIYQLHADIFHRLIGNAGFAAYFLKILSERLYHASKVERLYLPGNLTSAIGDLIVDSPVRIKPDATVAEAANIMHTAWADAALVMTEPEGIITDSDFLGRVLAMGHKPDILVKEVMSQPVKSLPADTPVYAALLFMIEHNVHHLAISDGEAIVGIATAETLLQHKSRNPLAFLRQLEHSEDPYQSLPKYALEIAETVETLYSGGQDVIQIGQIVASLNGALIRRLLRLAEEELGPPPTPYTWIVFGSEGRMEQLLLTDQDNALVFKTDSPGARDYFQSLAQRVVNGLIQAGIPACPGGYMATNWCRPLNEWLRLFKSWVRAPDPQALLEACIFFDFRAIYGDLSLEPLERVLYTTEEQGIFLAHLSTTTLEFRPPLSFFRRIQDDNGQVDIKKGGVAPIVHMARFYALQAGSRNRSTIERLQAAATAGKLSHLGAETLEEAYRTLLTLRLKEQIAETKAGVTPDNKIRLDSLSHRDRRRLREAFIGIRDLQTSISQHY